MIACSEAAYDLMILVRERWQQKHPEDELEYKVKCRALSSISMAETVTELTGSWFLDKDAILFSVPVELQYAVLHPFSDIRRRIRLSLSLMKPEGSVFPFFQVILAEPIR